MTIYVVKGHMEIAKTLLEYGADPNVVSMGYTSFHLAAGAGPSARGAGVAPNMEILELMLERGADINAQVSGTLSYSYNVSRDNANNNNEGNTALHAAARAGDVEMVRWLINKGADPGLLNAEDQQAVDLIPAAASEGGPGAGKGKGKGKGGPGGPNPAVLAEIRSLLGESALSR